MAQNNAATDATLMDKLEALAGEGRIPVEDLSHRDDPRLYIDTPAGEIRTKRKPDNVRHEGSATLRRWTWTPFTLEEEKDGQPGLDEPHAIVVKKND